MKNLKQLRTSIINNENSRGPSMLHEAPQNKHGKHVIHFSQSSHIDICCEYHKMIDFIKCFSEICIYHIHLTINSKTHKKCDALVCKHSSLQIYQA